jgi:hypothetical protein
MKRPKAAIVKAYLQERSGELQELKAVGLGQRNRLVEKSLLLGLFPGLLSLVFGLRIDFSRCLFK